MRNERGVVAESYHELQGLDVIARARETGACAPASSTGSVRTVFQAAEIALHNLSDLSMRAAADVSRGALGAAASKLGWALGFHRVLVCLGALPGELGRTVTTEAGRLRIDDSPALAAYLEGLALLERSISDAETSGALDLAAAIGHAALDEAPVRLIHSLRIGHHEMTIWRRALASVPVEMPVPSYPVVVASDLLREAVFGRTLAGDTAFTQFRGLHQIPEILGDEINHHLAAAIRALRDAGRARVACDHVDAAIALSAGVLSALPPIVDNLSTHDYHEIRENLGLTSGSHSIGIHYHMFGELYDQLADALSLRLVGREVDACGPGEIEDAVQRIAAEREDDADAWTLDQVVTRCLRFRAFTDRWRSWHLHLPRNNLGGNFTRSLTGSKDAIAAVRAMRDSARARDRFLRFARARGLEPDDPGAPDGDDPHASSLDARILAVTGELTQRRFRDVQDRLGFFGERAPFTPPPRRKV